METTKPSVNDATTPTGTRVLAGRYVLHDCIGSGGAGVVWRAQDLVLDRTVAVKLLHPELAADARAAARFRAEAAAAAKLTHPQTVVLYDIGRSEDGDYLVMELVEGGTLADVLDTGVLGPGVVAAIGGQVGRGLGAAHDTGLVHRDVKPANVLVTTDGAAKVTDFGIARALGETTARLTTPGQIMGTARYVAPEQLRDGPIDARADVYSLGLLLHQAVTGHLPFGDGSAVEVAMRRFADPLPRASDLRSGLPPELDAALDRATRQDPAERFADGNEFAAVLDPLADRDAGRQLAAALPNRWASVVPPAATDRRLAPAPLDATSPYAAPPAPAEQATAAGTTLLEAAPSDTPRTRRSAGWLALGALVVIAIGAVVTASLLPGADPPPAQDPPDDADEADDTGDDGGEVTPIEVVGSGDHDPFGSGEEHSSDVPHAFDGDPSTAWQTQRYRGSPELGGLKPGVGIWLELGSSQEVTEAVVTTTEPGASFSLFVGDAPPDAGAAPAEWGSEVASVTDAAASSTIELDEPVPARVWLLWFTSLPPDGGEYRATVPEVQVRGHSPED